MEILDKLGLGLWQICFHTLNLIILVIALWFFLYKPVKKIIAKGRENLDSVYKKNDELLIESEETKTKYAEMTENFKQEMIKTNHDAAEKIQIKSEAILTEAKTKADAIVDNARKEAAAEKERLKSDMINSVNTLAIDIAEKVLEREVTNADNQKIIDKCLSEWEK